MEDNSAAYPNVSTAVLQGGLQPLDYYLKTKAQKGNERMQRNKLRDAQDARRDKQLDELYKWAPDKAWSPYDEQVKEAAQVVRNKTQQLIAQGYTAQAARNEIQADRDRVNLLASKSQGAKEQYEAMRQEFTDNGFLDWEGYYKSRVNDIYFEGGNFLSGKNLEEADFSSAEELIKDIGGYKRDEIAKSVVEKLPSMVDEFYTKLNQEHGYEKYQITEIKRNILGEVNPKTGKKTVRITDEFEALARNNKYLNALLEDAEAKGIDAKEFLKEMFGGYAEAGMQKSIKTVKTQNASDKDDETTFVRDKIQDGIVNINFSHKNPSGDSNISAHPIQEIDGYRISGKNMDKPMYVDLPGYYDVDKGEYIKGNVGDMKLIPTRIRLLPVQKGKDNKFMPWPDRETVKMGLVSNKDELKWYVQAVIPGELGDDQRNILIPYEQVANDLKAKYGFDLSEREVKDMDDFEIITMINKQNPGASAEEKMMKFKELKSSL